MQSERKIDDSLPKTQFLGDVNGGGILFYVREDIPAKLLSAETLPTQSAFMLNLIYGKKWLVSCIHQKYNISNHLQTISKSLYLYLSQYDNIFYSRGF